MNDLGFDGKFDEKSLQRLLERGKSAAMDLSRDEDLSIGVMNLISLEEHLFFTNQKTGDGKYLQLLGEVRKTRVKLLARIVKDPKGEEWCISKHLLAASMRLMEVGTKELENNPEDAKEFFGLSFGMYSLFWGINLGVGPDTDNVSASHPVTPTEVPASVPSATFTGKLAQVVKQIVDCCREL